MSNEASTVHIEDELDALFHAYVEANQAPGLVYGITSADGLTHCAGFGVVNPVGERPSLDTPFPIASMSKSFTAAAALLARDRELLDLDDPITTYIPRFRVTGPTEDDLRPPTIRMLLSMAGGLTEDNSWVDPQIDMSEDELERLVAAGVRYSHLPGTVYEYSNTGYALVGLAVQRATAQSIDEFVTAELLIPLGMRNTAFSPSTFADDVRAAGYSLDEHDQWVPFPPIESGAFAAAGGMLSTVRDLATWTTWLGEAFRPGQSTGPAVLGRDSRRELQRLETFEAPYYSRERRGTWRLAVGGYALGLRVSYDLHFGTIISHAGGLPGFTLYMCWHPLSGAGILVLTNSHRGDPVGLGHEALLMLLQRSSICASTVVLWPETVRARLDAERLIRQWDDSLAAELFATNVDFDRPLRLRRTDLERLVSEVGPLRTARPVDEVVSAASPAEVTWSIPAERGELICMVHLTPFEPPQVQEFLVQAVPAGTPRSATPFDVSPHRAARGVTSLSQNANVRVVVPTLD